MVKSKVGQGGYIILSDPDTNTLSLHTTALKYFYEGEIIQTTSITETIAALSEGGRPELLFIDYDLLVADEGRLHKYLENAQMHIPLIAALNLPLDPLRLQKFPVSSILHKPVSAQDLTTLVKQITASSSFVPTHVPVSMRTILEFTNGEFDYYLRLSSNNYIKVIKKGDPFTPQDYENFLAKGINEVHIKASDSHELLRLCEENLRRKLNMDSTTPNEEYMFEAIIAVEQVEAISKVLGWSDDVLKSTRKILEEAVTAFTQDKNLVKILRQRLTNPSSEYARHIGLQTFLTTGLCMDLGLSGEGGPMKLALASMLHDLTVDESYYEDISSWNKKASDPQYKSSEVVRYRLHPVQAAQKAQTLAFLPPDVDQIIMQHHEKGDGGGFPRALGAHRITALASLFIMVEDLLEFLPQDRHVETALKDYLTWGESMYTNGYFHKFYLTLKEKIANGLE